MRDLSRRVLRLERELDVLPLDDSGPQLLKIIGGLPCDRMHAQIGDRRLEALDGEELEEFQDRCFAEAMALQAPLIVLGGLNPTPWPDGGTES